MNSLSEMSLGKALLHRVLRGLAAAWGLIFSCRIFMAAYSPGLHSEVKSDGECFALDP